MLGLAHGAAELKGITIRFFATSCACLSPPSRAIELLSRELGAADTLRFVNQFTSGYGDYTAERDSLFGTMTLDEILAEIQASAPDSPV